MTDLKTYASVGAILAALAAAPAVAQDMSEWDTNGDGVIDQEEFNTGHRASDAYTTWDGDASGAISEEEFDTGVTSAFDMDASGDLNEEEQSARDESRWGDRSFSDWDEDASGDLNDQE